MLTCFPPDTRHLCHRPSHCRRYSCARRNCFCCCDDWCTYVQVYGQYGPGTELPLLRLRKLLLPYTTLNAKPWTSSLLRCRGRHLPHPLQQRLHEVRFWVSPSNVADRATAVKQAFEKETDDEKEGQCLPVIDIRHCPDW